MLSDWKNKYSQNDNTTQGNLQLQCNLYKIINDILYRARTKYLKIFMETQKTSNSQSNIEKKKTELEESASLTSDSTTKIQSSKCQGTGTKREIQINVIGWKAQK